MKAQLKITLIAIGLAGLLGLALSSCEKDEETHPAKKMAGTWVFEKETVSGEFEIELYNSEMRATKGFYTIDGVEYEITSATSAIKFDMDDNLGYTIVLSSSPNNFFFNNLTVSEDLKSMTSSNYGYVMNNKDYNHFNESILITRK
jgi:hypothetical protein